MFERTKTTLVKAVVLTINEGDGKQFCCLKLELLSSNIFLFFLGGGSRFRIGLENQFAIEMHNDSGREKTIDVGNVTCVVTV